MTFEELSLIENKIQNRLGLVYKYPLIVCMIGTFIYKRRVYNRSKNMFFRDMYFRVNTPELMTSNNLNSVLVIVEVMNLISFGLGAGFSGIIYLRSFWNRYFELTYKEEELG